MDEVVNQSQLLIKAVESHFIAERTKALANLNNYFSNPVAIGEHPDIVDESIKLLEKISHADGVLETLKRIAP